METFKGSILTDILLPLVVIIFIIAVGVVLLYQHFQKNLFAHKLKQETLKNIHRADLLRSNIEAEEEERKRIAQDIHDELGAVLSIMRMKMVLLEEQNKEVSGDLLNGLQNVRELSETALTGIRGISHRLMPPQLETFGLIKTLESVVQQINNTGNINILINAAMPLPDLPKQLNLGLYRIIMELINNTIKHSGATLAEVELGMKDQNIICNYFDNGKGLAPGYQNKGLGHKSIDGRINALEGHLEIGNAPAGGFKAGIRIPVRSPLTSTA